MSHIVKTQTPFVDQNLLIEALDNLNINYNISSNRIIVSSNYFYRQEYFEFSGGKYRYIHDSDNRNTRNFIADVTKEYNKAHERLLERIRKAEEELKRKQEEERLRKLKEEKERKRKEEEKRIIKELERLRKLKEEEERKRKEEEEQIRKELERLRKLKEEEERKRKEEEERIRKELERLRKEKEEMERKRLELIENNKKMITGKAKKMGYKVKESKKNGKIKMVLVKRTY